MMRRSAAPLVDPLVSVVMPAYNERDTVEEIIRRVLAVPLRLELIVVDDCSTDGTRELLQTLQGELGLTLLLQPRNAGKGAAVRAGFAKVVGEIVVIQDADLEYSPEEYPSLVELICSGRADVVYGSRFLGGPQRVHYFWHYVANRVLTLLSDISTNLKLSDMETCYKVFRREVLQGIQVKSDRFGFEPEITAKIAKGKWRIYEVPISYAGRTYEEGKKITWKDGVQALWCIIRFRLGD